MFVGHYAVGFGLKKQRPEILLWLLFLSIQMVLLALGFVGMFLAPEKEATPAAASVMSLSLYAVFTAMAVWCDRRIKSGGNEVLNLKG